MNAEKRRWACPLLAVGLFSAGCAASSEGERTADTAAELASIAACSNASAAGYSAIDSSLTLDMGVAPNLVFGVVRGFITVNGETCVKKASDGGAALTASMVKKVTINGSSQDDEVVIDTLSGPFGSGILSAAGGISVNLGGQTSQDTFILRGSAAADKWSAGASGGNTFFEINGDNSADIKVSGAEVLQISLSSGNDTFSARGGALAATHLNGGTPLTTLGAVSADMTILGGDGDDIITPGDGNDSVDGGNGNDVFKAAAAPDGNDTFHGGDGVDRIDYSLRSAALWVALDQRASGEISAGEADSIDVDVEDLSGGSGDDILIGNGSSNHIRGGAGNDTLNGGAAGSSCASDVDILDGEAGDDTFDMGASNDCADTLNGGTGKDIADYRARSVDLEISIDGSANDGDALTQEKDNVQRDVEVVLGGAGNDTIVGSASADELHGGPGNDVISAGAGNDVLIGNTGDDVLNGEAGDDTFAESGSDAYYADAMQPLLGEKGAGNDILNGGSHDTLGLDSVDYSARATFVSVSLCMDARQLGAPVSLAASCVDHDGEAGESDNVVNVTHLIGSANDDVLNGGSADDIIEGLAGNDTLHGGAGNDTLYGDDGDDTLFGDAGDDKLFGGASTNHDALDGDDGANLSDGDICVGRAGDTLVNCEL